MSTVKDIEAAIRELPDEARWELLHRFEDTLWSEWDRQIESDLVAGRLDHLIAEARADIASGRTRDLDEVLNNS